MQILLIPTKKDHHPVLGKGKVVGAAGEPYLDVNLHLAGVINHHIAVELSNNHRIRLINIRLVNLKG